MEERNVRTSGTRRVYGGLYDDPAAAERGIRRFQESGYEGERIGIVSRDRDDAKEVAENTGASAATGAATGAVAGGLLGGLTGLLVGIGALAIPGIGPVVAGGALASAFGIGGRHGRRRRRDRRWRRRCRRRPRRCPDQPRL